MSRWPNLFTSLIVLTLSGCTNALDVIMVIDRNQDMLTGTGTWTGVPGQGSFSWSAKSDFTGLTCRATGHQTALTSNVHNVNCADNRTAEVPTTSTRSLSYYAGEGVLSDGARVRIITDFPNSAFIQNDIDAFRRVAKSSQTPPTTTSKAQNQPVRKNTLPTLPLDITYKTGKERPDDIAVIIGNANYAQGQDIPNVTPAYADAESFKRYAVSALGIREGNIIDLRDATSAQFAAVFGTDTDYKGKLFNWIRPGISRITVYYAGHGAPAGKDGSALLIPTDADAAAIDLTGYPLSRLYNNLAKIPAQSITVVLEACFSGASPAGALISNASPVFMKSKAPQIPANLTVISAGGANQMASWEQDKSHSLFTKYYLKGVSGDADQGRYGNGDGEISSEELKAYLRDTLSYFARRYYGREQDAQIHASR